MIVPDVIAADLRVLFVGVNPGMCSSQMRHHFAHPTARLWKALHEAGFTPYTLRPTEESRLPAYGIGLTNLVDRPTSSADQLTAEELGAGAERLHRLVCRYRPGWVAILGLVAYRIAFHERQAQLGPQPVTLCSSRLWVLPGPTGRNAHYPLPQLVKEFRQLRRAVG